MEGTGWEGAERRMGWEGEQVWEMTWKSKEDGEGMKVREEVGGDK